MAGRVFIMNTVIFGNHNLYLCFDRDVIPISSCYLVLNGLLSREMEEMEVK